MTAMGRVGDIFAGMANGAAAQPIAMAYTGWLVASGHAGLVVLFVVVRSLLRCFTGS